MKGVLLGVSLLVCSWGSFSYGFTLCAASNSSMGGWQTKLLKFKINPTNCPPNVNDLIDTAMALWNSVPTSSLVMKREGTSTEDPANLANTSYLPSDVAVIACDSAFGSHYGSGTQNYITGVGTCHIQGGVVTHGSLVLNTQSGATANISNLSAAQQQVVVAHELGHAIGLGHSTDQSALMFFDVASKTKLGLAQDDIDGMTYLYPRNEIGGDLPFGCGSISSANSRPPSSSHILFWVFPLFMTAAFRFLKFPAKQISG